MAQINLAEVIQQNLGFPSLQKISPDTQEVKHEEEQYTEDKLSQAAIPSVLTGLYLLATSEAGASIIMGGNISTTWVETIFKDKTAEAVQKIADYAGTSKEEASSTMENIANEAIKITHQQIPDKAAPNQVNEFFTSQRDKILVYLPGSLQIGQILKDDTLDDRTNKMEGPVSGLMHKLEKAFSSGTKDQ